MRVKAEDHLLLASLAVVGCIGETRRASCGTLMYRFTAYPAKFDPEKVDVDVERIKPSTNKCSEGLSRPGGLICQIADSTVFLSAVTTLGHGTLCAGSSFFGTGARIHVHLWTSLKVLRKGHERVRAETGELQKSFGTKPFDHIRSL